MRAITLVSFVVLCALAVAASDTYKATSVVNIRSGPGTTYNIVGSLSAGQTVVVTSISNGWAKFSKGYSSASYLTKVSSGGSTGGSTSLTISQLKAIYNNLSDSKANIYLPYLNAAMKEASINTPLRIAHFMAQLGTESAGLVYWEEIASGSEYEGRKDLGNTQPGDGKRYKGRGPIQITGRSNYKACGTALGLDLINNPTLLIQPQNGFRSAGWYWDSRNINAKADADDILACTRAVNGGTNGFDSRKAYLAKAKKALGI
jgi:predicted chitinase